MKITTLLFAVISLAVIAGQVSAQGKGTPKGPNAKGASVSAATVCIYPGTNPEGDEDDSYLDVAIRVYDKTSGEGIAPAVSEWSISVLAKTDRGPWVPDNFEVIGGDLSTPTELLALDTMVDEGDPNLVIGPKSYGLCGKLAGIDGVKGLNAMASIEYGALNDAGTDIGTSRDIMNMCSDDPNTDSIIESNGIKLTDADIDEICGASLTNAAPATVAEPESTTEVIVTEPITPETTTPETTTSETTTSETTTSETTTSETTTSETITPNAS